jgi:hypothetical protein
VSRFGWADCSIKPLQRRYSAGASSRAELVDALGRMIRQPGEDVSEPGLRIDLVELRGRDERIESSRPAATFVRAGEGPVAAPERDGTQLAFSGVIGHAQAPVIEEAGERAPAFEGALLAQPSLQFDNKRPAALIAHAQALLWHHAIDLALDSEQHIDALDRLDCDWRLVDLCQIEEFAPRMGPAAASTIGPGLRLAS